MSTDLQAPPASPASGAVRPVSPRPHGTPAVPSSPVAETEAHRPQAASGRSVSAFGVSLAVHSLILGSMWFIRDAVIESKAEVQIESVVTEDRIQEDFSKVIETDTAIAENMNIVPGGMVSTQIAANSLGGGGGGGGGGGTGSGGGGGVRLGSSAGLSDPNVRIGSGDVAMPGDGMLGMDFGEAGVRGEGGAFVEGYGAALGRITQELVRMMRQDPVMVVWLFDESESMKDDQAEISQKFHKVYEELGILTKKDADFRKKGTEILLTSIVGYGEGYHPITAKPTSDIAEIRAAIDKIGIDESGKENTCAAIAQAINDHRSLAQRQKRKLVVVVVSDESGDDGDKIELTLDLAVKAKAPIYVMGRESIFGYPFARVRWQDPQYKLWHWLQINRGPETAFRECLQWDGLHARWDSFSSGFGPYEQVRLAKETGGIFFVLPGEEENLTGAGAHEKRQFDALDMKEYEPNLIARREYLQELADSSFRSTVSEVIRILDPAIDTQLNINQHHYKLDIKEFEKQAITEVVKANRAMTGLNQVLPMFEKIKSLRARERSQRWRANYDLIYAQLYAYRIRLFQYLLAMDDHLHTNPKPKSPTSNEWYVRYTQRMIEPNEDQYGRLKKHFKLKETREQYLAELKEHGSKAREMFQLVIDEHPGTPWARRAKYELDLGFGMEFRDHFWDPKYYNLGIKVPKF